MSLAAANVVLCVGTSRPERGAIALFDAYWCSLPKRQGLPLLQDFRPEQIQAVMPNLMMKEVLREPLDFRFRLFGSTIITELGKDYTGLKFSEIDGYDRDGDVWENNEFVVDERLISTMHIPYVGRSRDFLHTRQSSYPFSEDGADVDYIVTVVEFHPRKLVVN